MAFGKMCIERSDTKKMSDNGKNATDVSTGYVRSPGPASESPSSKDPPSYSVCVPDPPTINSNDPDGHSPLLVDPPEMNSPSKISNLGNHAENLPEGKQCSPALPSSSENLPGVHAPQVAPDNGQPANEPSCTATQGNPPPHGNEKKTMFLYKIRGHNRKNKSFGGRTLAVIAIAITAILFAIHPRPVHDRDVPNVLGEQTIDFGGKHRFKIFDRGNGTVVIDLGMITSTGEKQLFEIEVLEFLQVYKPFFCHLDIVRPPADDVKKVTIRSITFGLFSGGFHVTDFVMSAADLKDYLIKKFRKVKGYPDASFNKDTNDFADRFPDMLGISQKVKVDENAA